jgi:kumamolisin
MRGMSYLLSVAGVIYATSTFGQDVSTFGSRPVGRVFLPLSSIPLPRPQGVGTAGPVEAVTNVAVFIPAVQVEPPTTGGPASVPGNFTETPASIACIYGLTITNSRECDPNKVHENATGGSRVIAIVDAFDAPNAESDLAVFSQRFGLPKANFQKVYATGARPDGTGISEEIKKGWELEISLDIEWAHAMAPNAKIILVEAASNSNKDLMFAEQKASDIVNNEGGGEISNSWSMSEFPDESNGDNQFLKQGVVYLAASGDNYYTQYPSSSPNVIAVGGTSILRDSTGAFISEAPWWNNKGGEGAGSSPFQPRPDFQASVSSIVGLWRGIPDLVAVADPSVGGVWVYDSANVMASSNKGWLSEGGTSAATPIVAALINKANHFAASSAAELAIIYSHLGTRSFTDITTGKCGPGQFYSANAGWDYCSGVGSPNGVDGL